MVDGKPFIMLAGALHNSTSSGIKYMNDIDLWDGLAEMNLNTVIATVSWELFEPEEGEYNYSHVDYLINEAHKRGLKLILVWYGTFKNPFRTYAPAWVVTNPKRFPRAKDQDGNDLVLPSIFETDILEADTRAYIAFLSHVKDVDKDNTVIMIQVQNEPGLRDTPRDFSKEAEKAWKSEVPTQLIDYLKKNRGTLQPDLEKVWSDNGYKTSGNWEEIFGKSLVADDGSNNILFLTEHLFTAYFYAKYIDYMSVEGKNIHPLPTYTNASVFGLNARGKSLGAGCSIPEFFDMYRAGAPSLDILAPNSYIDQLDLLCEEYFWKGNPILIPESTIFGARALFSIGEYDAIGFSPFGIDDYIDNNTNSLKISSVYKLIDNMKELIYQNIGSDMMRGVYLYPQKESQVLEMGDYQLSFSPLIPYTRASSQNNMESDLNKIFSSLVQQMTNTIEPCGAIVIKVSDNEFYIAGTGLNVDIKLKDPIKSNFSGILSIDDGEFVDNKFVTNRRLNGDEKKISFETGTYSILKVCMYHY